jgi:hypothetical protein
MYYWTSGALLNTADEYDNGNIIWCSSNVTSEVDILSKQSDGGEKCVAFERWTGKFKELNCSKRLSFICEVEFYLNHFMCVLHSYISVSLSKRSLSPWRPVCQKRLKIVIFCWSQFNNSSFRQLYFTRKGSTSSLIVLQRNLQLNLIN